MATININRKVTDSYYRYKMPRIQAKVEGRGNGIKTVIANLSEVSKALNRPPLYPLKYIGCELGAQTIGDTKNDRFIVNGAHDPDKLQNILDTFIEKYVLCVSCSNPETILSVSSKKETITMRCIACGHTCKVSLGHRATTYMLKNPPPSTKSIKDKVEPNKSNTTPKDNNENNLMNSTNIDYKSANINSTNDDDCQWNADVSEAAVRKRQQMLSSHLRAMTLDDDTHRPIHEKLEILREFIQHKLATNNNLNDHFSYIVCEVKRLDIENKAIFAISNVIFDGDLVKQLQQHYLFLRNFCSQQPKVQKYLLASIERTIEQHMDQLIDKVPIIFKILFEADIIEEEVFLDWDSKQSSRFVSKETSKKIKNSAFKFMDWLKNAEEESSDSDDASDEERDVINNDDVVNNGDDKLGGSKIVNAADKSDDVMGVVVSGDKIGCHTNGVQNECKSMHLPEKDNDENSDINIDDI